jgi:hypothetical protein
MKSLGQYIKLIFIYTPRYFQVIFLILVAFWTIETLFGQELQPGNPGTSVVIFLTISYLIIFWFLYHLNELKQNPALALAPHFFKNHLFASGLLLGVSILLVVVVTSLAGRSILITLNICLFPFSIFIWVIFQRRKFQLSWYFFTTYLVIMIYAMMGFIPIKLFSFVPALKTFGSTFIFQILLLTISGVLLFAFFRSLLRRPLYKFLHEEPHQAAIDARYFDNHNRLTARIVKRNITHLFQYSKNKKKSMVNIARILQYGLFNPGNSNLTTVFFYCLAGLLFILLLDGFLTYKIGDTENIIEFLKGGRWFSPALPFIFIPFYTYSAICLGTDFLRHRDRISTLWLLTPVNSRKEFIKGIILSYLWVVSKHFLVISLLYVLVLMMYPGLHFSSLLPLMIIGIMIYIFFISISLYRTPKINAKQISTWLITNLSIFLTLFFIWYLLASAGRLSLSFSSTVLIIIICLAFFNGFLFITSLYECKNIELNFTN